MRTVQYYIVASRGRNPDNPSDRSKGIKLVQRLQEIDNKLCPETSMDVTEYNLIMEQIWGMISEDKKEQPKKRVRKR